MKTGKILIVADNSPSSVKAIQYGFKLAGELGAKVMLLSVVEAALATGNVDAGIFPDDALIDLKRKTEDFLSRMKSDYGGSIDTDLMAPVGAVQKTVIHIAREWKADMIVAGTHSRTGLSKLFNASVAESIIHHSPVPVCVVPPGE